MWSSRAAPTLGAAICGPRLDVFRAQYDEFRTATICEPRGSEVVVGALLCEPSDPSAAAAVIFYNDVGYLGMCGHGTIGVVTTLAHLGRIGPGEHVIETPVGPVVDAPALGRKRFHRECSELPLSGGCARGSAGLWLLSRRYRVGWELVLPCLGPRTFATNRKSRRAAGGFDGDSCCSDRIRHHRK